MGTGSQTSTNKDKYLPEWFRGDGDNAHENHDSVEGDHNGESGPKASSPKKPGKKKHCKGKITKRGDPKRKQPKKLLSFRDVRVMASVSMAGPSGTVSRHQMVKKPPAVTFRREEWIPHGLWFNATDGKGDSHCESSTHQETGKGGQPGPNQSKGGNGSDDSGIPSRRGRNSTRPTGGSGRRSVMTPPIPPPSESRSTTSGSSSSSKTSSSSSSSSPSSPSSSSPSPSSPSSSSSSPSSSSSSARSSRRKRRGKKLGSGKGKGSRKQGRKGKRC